MNMMNANKLMALLGLEYPTTSRYKELHAAVTQALEVARVEGATDCCMAYDCERLKPQPAEPVQKLRPDFIAGYDAGMKDMMRRVKTEIAEQPLPEPQPEPVRSAVKQYDLDQSPDYRKGYEDGRRNGYEVGKSHAAPQSELSDAIRVLSFFAGLDLTILDMPANFAWYVLEARAVLAALAGLGVQRGN